MTTTRNIEAKIVADSVNPAGRRITSFILTYPRFIHSELMTHRMLCLAGDSELEFDLPSNSMKGYRRVYRMRLDEFVDKWSGGARRYGGKPKNEVDLSWVDDGACYAAVDVASRFGMRSASNINQMCRNGEIPAFKEGRVWMIKGADVRAWRTSACSENRYDMKTRLRRMRIRQLNEDTGDIQTSTIVDAVSSGRKTVYAVIAGGFCVAGSEHHRVLTHRGWVPIKEIVPGEDYVVVRKFGKHDDHKLDPLRLKKLDGKWRSRWQDQQRALLRKDDPMCRRCGSCEGSEIHHIQPVYAAPDLAFEQNNISLLCSDCHKHEHRTQGWQGGTYLYGGLALVEDIRERGEEETFDLEISGRYPNFLANGVVVHNSRNAASSRAIPVKKMLKAVEDDPAFFEQLGLAHKGMQASGELDDEIAGEFYCEWYQMSREVRTFVARAASFYGLHKQVANRALEPWMHMTSLWTATEWDNFFSLRAHPDAQPEFQVLAFRMLDLYLRAEPEKLSWGEWHLPFVEGPELTIETGLKVSVARSARVSYTTFDGDHSVEKDCELHDRMIAQKPIHASPFEHQACAVEGMRWSGNFKGGWQQYRKSLEGEVVKKANLQQIMNDKPDWITL